MTPTQLRAYSAVVRLGSVKRAATQLEVSESAVSLHIGQLRRELGDQLFTRSAAGPASTPVGDQLFTPSAAGPASTPGRVAAGQPHHRAAGPATPLGARGQRGGRGRRLLRVAASSLFAEHARPA